MAFAAREHAKGVRVAVDIGCGAARNLFTFSRRTVPAAAVPVPGDSFVFREFSGEPQCFFTARQLIHSHERLRSAAAS
jgi:hypothetical protein